MSSLRFFSHTTREEKIIFSCYRAAGGFKAIERGEETFSFVISGMKLTEFGKPKIGMTLVSLYGTKEYIYRHRVGQKFGNYVEWD